MVVYCGKLIDNDDTPIAWLVPDAISAPSSAMAVVWPGGGAGQCGRVYSVAAPCMQECYAVQDMTVTTYTADGEEVTTQLIGTALGEKGGGGLCWLSHPCRAM